MGWTVSPNAAVAQQLTVLNEPLTGSLTVPLQDGMLAALTEDDTGMRRESVLVRRDRTLAVLAQHGISAQPPQGSIFFFLDISATCLSGDEFSDRLLAEEHVAVVPGSGFGLPWRVSDAAYVPSELAARCIRLLLCGRRGTAGQVAGWRLSSRQAH
jgi:aspartate/methionine/tyrosine aminotransferase